MADEKEMTSVEEIPIQEAPEVLPETAETVVEEAPEAPAEEAPEAPAEEAPEATVEEAPEDPAEEAPEAPAEEAPEAPTEEAPEASAEEAPEAPVEEAPEATVEEAPKAPAEEKAPAAKTSTVGDKVMTAIGIVLCVILAPLLIANLTMIIKSYTNSDDVPSFGGYCPFIIMTDSMQGTINAGDLIFDKVVTDPEEIKRDDIISFFDPASRTQSIVTHRVIEITKDKDGLAFITKGDANNTHDDDPVPAKNVVGVYCFRLPGMGNVVMFMQSTTGLVVCVALPILLLIAYDAIRRRQYDKRQKADTDALLAELEELRAKKQD